MITISNTNHWLNEQSNLIPNNRVIITQNKTFTYSEFFDYCLHVFDHLDQLGIKEKDNVGILFEHHYNIFVIVNALWMIGAVPIPLNTRNTNIEVEYQLHQADIKHLIIDENLSRQYSHLHFQNKIQISDVQKIDVSNKTSKILNSSTCLPAERVAELKRNGGRFSILNPALIVFTSGSSGNTKAVVHNFRSLFASVRMTDSITNLTKEDVWLASLPFYHIGGFMILVRALLSGGSVAFPNSLKHEDITKAITIFNPTHVSIVSPTLARILKDDFVPSTNLKFVFLGGGQISATLCEQAINKGWQIIKVYGSTETCSMVSALLPAEVNQKSDSVGKFLGSNKIKIKRISKNDSVDFCSDGEVGEIVVSSQSLFAGYYNDTSTTENVLKNGWYHTGDYGWLDKEGYLYIASRREDLIITGGENVNALDVQEAIKSHSLIEDAFVFALEDDVWGQIVCAAVVSKEISELEIINFLKEKIAGYKIPKQFHFVKSIPKNEIGKVNRAELMNQLNVHF